MMSNPNFPKKTRAMLIERGTTLTRWAREQGYSVKTAHKAVRGERNGPKSYALLQELKRFLAA